jgi:hypothetical protein
VYVDVLLIGNQCVMLSILINDIEFIYNTVEQFISFFPHLFHFLSMISMMFEFTVNVSLTNSMFSCASRHVKFHGYKQKWNQSKKSTQNIDEKNKFSKSNHLFLFDDFDEDEKNSFSFKVPWFKFFCECFEHFVLLKVMTL